MKNKKIYTGILVLFLLFSCDKHKAVDWSLVKNEIVIVNNLPDEYQNPQPLPLNSMAWEDGLFVTRDGLDLYCIYIPADLISFVNDGAKQKKAHLYMRGNPLDMDIKSNPDHTKNWIHGDIYHSKRLSVNDEFTSWEAVNIAIPVFNEGAPQGIALPDHNFDFFVYMKQKESAPYDNNLWYQKNVGRELETSGKLFPPQINSDYNEDNPHIERLSEDTLILFFEREDHPKNLSPFNIWYSMSYNNGASWQEAENLTSINTFGDVFSEHIQPHLYFDAQIKNWYLYFTTNNFNGDGKLAIYRSLKGNNWNDWQEPELVLSSGNALGIGEPSVSDHGDLYFVVVIENPDGSTYDKYDCDAWMIKKK